MAEPLLELENVTIRFGGLTAVSEFSIRLDARGLTGLIGPNGAGKTTVFNLITGVYQPTSGRITFCGRKVAGLAPHRLARLGIARTFQNIRLFGSMTVLDNVRTALQLHNRGGVRGALWRGAAFERSEAEVVTKACELLDIFDLARLRDEEATALPYGDQRRLEIVRALAAQPKLLLLDEPAAGMNPVEKEELAKLIRFIQDKFQIAVLLVEHDMKVVMGVSERVVVLDYGKMIAAGTPEEVQANPKVIAAYLGKEDGDDA